MIGGLPPPDPPMPLADVENPRPAAILVPIVEVDGAASIVVTKRAAAMRHHRDDWVFPGGRTDPERDRGPEDTARREACEELGIDAHQVEVVGRLQSHGPIVTGFIIDVVVAVLHATTVIRPNPQEVAAVAVVSLSELAAATSYEVGIAMPAHDTGPVVGRLIERDPRDDTGPSRLRAFTIRPGELLWGTQANILHELLTVLAR